MARTKARLGVAALLALGLAAVAGSRALRAQEPAAPAPRARGRVLLVSLDGLRPEVYLEPGFATPNLRALAARGISARRVDGVFPTLTYPAHATLATGCRPARHGIVSNTVFDPRDGGKRWYWEASHLLAPALWDAERAAGGRTAAVRWPTTVGARAIDWNIPEAFDADPAGDHLAALRAATTPGLLEAVWPKLPEDPRDDAALDAGATEATARIIERDRPELVLLHLIQADAAQHRFGRDDPHVAQAFAALDSHLGRLLRALETAGVASATNVVVTGDHGFRDLHTRVRPNVLLREAGLVTLAGEKVQEWSAFAHASGGSAAVYLRSPGDRASADRALAALRAAADGRYRGLFTVVDRETLDREGAFPGALCALDSEAGYAFEDEATGTVLAPSHARGVHGARPEHRELATGLVGAGPGLLAGRTVPVFRQVDVAPLAAHLLGCELGPAVEGVLVPGILAR